MAVPTEQGTPKAEIQLGNHLTVCAGLAIADQLLAGFDHACLLIRDRQGAGIVHPADTAPGGKATITAATRGLCYLGPHR